jgi:hypothetical protein
MNAIRNGDVEIVGFNGAPAVECGRALAVARRKSDGMHCVLKSAEDAAGFSWYDEEEAAAFAKARRWTKLREPLPLHRSSVSSPDGRVALQPMVVFAARAFLDTAGQVAWPSVFRHEILLWRGLEQGHDSIRASCASAGTVESLLDDWAVGLKERYNAMYHQGREQASLKRVADFMLCSARSRPLRWQAYLRYAMVQDPDRVRQTFDAFTKNEFPDVPWEAYLDQIRSMGDVLKAVPVMQSHPAAQSSSSLARGKLGGIGRRPPLDVQLPSAA